MKRISERQFKEDQEVLKNNECHWSVKNVVKTYVEALREAYKEIDRLRNPRVPKEQLVEILDHFNAVCDKRSQHLPRNYDPIRKILNTGVSVQDCKDVISLKYTDWGDDPEMERHVSIHTFFARRNFFKYLDQFQNLTPEEQCQVRSQQTFKMEMDTL